MALTLNCSIPATYPDTAPQLEIILNKGLTEQQQVEMSSLLSEQIEELSGMAMIFTLCESLKEYLVENNQKGNDGSEYQEMVRRATQQEKKEAKVAAEAAAIERQRELDDEGPKEIIGTPVTVESFNDWKLKFEAENLNVHGTFAHVRKTDKLTGRQLWLQGLDKNLQGDDAESDDDSEYEEEEEENSNDEEEQ